MSSRKRISGRVDELDIHSSLKNLEDGSILDWAKWFHSDIKEAPILIFPEKGSKCKQRPKAWRMCRAGIFNGSTAATVKRTRQSKMQEKSSTLMLDSMELPTVRSHRLFCWLIPIFKSGLIKDLELTDLCASPQEIKSEVVDHLLGNYWSKELAKVTQSKSPSLPRASFNSFGSSFVYTGLLLGLKECGVVVGQVMLLALLLRTYRSKDADERMQSYFFAGGIVLLCCLSALLHHLYYMKVHDIGLKVELGCSTLIYRKCLALSQFALTETTVGQMVNLLSNDISRLGIGLAYTHSIWVGLLQTLIIGIILWRYLGPTLLSGISVLIIFIPLQAFMGKIFAVFREKTSLLADARIRLMHDILSAMKTIKMLAWEYLFQNVVKEARWKEVTMMRKIFYTNTLSMSLAFMAKKIILVLIFLVYVMTGNTLAAEVVFVTSALINCVCGLMVYTLPIAVSCIVNMQISFERIQKFLLMEELERISNVTVSQKVKPHQLCLEHITASWNRFTHKPTLNDISFTLFPGKLAVIIGPVGSGKTSLLMAILGELPLSSGTTKVPGKLAFCPQEPWIFGGSIRQNILFGQPYDKNFYEEVLQLCALEEDMMQLPFGDLTPLGDKGFCLSGGQKARINLASVIQKFLRHKLVILVTHQLHFVKEAAYIFVMKDGKCVHQTNNHNLLNRELDFATSRSREEQCGNVTKLKTDTNNFTSDCYVDNASSTRKRKRDVSENSVILTKEKKKTGSIKMQTYVQYFRAGANVFVLLLLIALNVVNQILYSGSDYWLSIWTNEQERKDECAAAAATHATQRTNISHNCDKDFLDNTENLYIYSGFVSGAFLMTFCKTFLFFWICTKASAVLHDLMFFSIIRCPMAFFHSNPFGRILNRFAKDMEGIEERLVIVFDHVITDFMNVMGILVIFIMINKWITISNIALVLTYLFIIRVYLASARDIKRLEAITRSPIISHLSESICGLTVIRAFKMQDAVKKSFERRLNLHSAVSYVRLYAGHWLGAFMDLVSLVFVASVVLVVMLTSENNLGGDVGLAISTAIFLTNMAQWSVRQWTEVENEMISVERVLEYNNLKSEASLSVPKHKPPKDWPQRGEVLFQDVELKYGSSDVPVLKNINFRINAGEKIGIVGRTGAGKSSIIEALFRLTEPSGSIIIDGILVSEIGLHDLRGRMSVIPQDPVLFQGTIRRNIDPFLQFTDAELWQVLEEVRLKPLVQELLGGLETVISEGGSNFSTGQKQLICLARALLRKNRILILDEATANVDPMTSELIQNMIRDKFMDCTVLTIAHTLNTVMDADRVLVVDGGQIVEFDSPYVLLQNATGTFAQMVKQTGRDIADHLKTIAETSYLSKISGKRRKSQQQPS